MSIIDRYVLRLFVKVLAVSFISFTGLYVVTDTVGNLEEFISYGRTEGGLLKVLAEYYGARVFSFFDSTSSLLALIAAMFTVTWLQRTNELTALMAAGISKGRVVKPLVAAVVVVSLAAVANRECVIPTVRDRLARNAQDWLGESARSVRPCYDNNSDILIDGRHCFAADQRIAGASFRLHRPLGLFTRGLLAENAYYRPPEAGRPGGYLLRGVTQPKQLTELPTALRDGKPVIHSPADTPWLKPGECFVVSEVDFEQLSGGDAWRRYSSTPQLISGLRKGSLDYGADVRVTVHARVVQPFLDMTLLFLGLPLVLTRESRNVFIAAGLCLLLVTVFFLVVLACQAMGTHGYLLSPSLAAWCPLMIFAPVAVAAAAPVWES
jgi:lipopolysaccharide export system permease protein